MKTLDEIVNEVACIADELTDNAYRAMINDAGKEAATWQVAPSVVSLKYFPRRLSEEELQEEIKGERK